MNLSNLSLEQFERLLEKTIEKKLQAFPPKASIDKNTQKAYLTLDDLANYIYFSKSTIYKLVEKGAIPVYRVNKKLLFKTEEINKWIEGYRA